MASLSEEEQKVLTEGLTSSPPPLHGVAGVDPNKAVEHQRMARRLDAPLQVVRDHPEQARSVLTEQDIRNMLPDRPKLAEWLSDPNKAEIAWDDVEPLGQLEDHALQRDDVRGYWENQLRGIANTSAKIFTEGMAGAAWFSEGISKPFTQAYDEAKRLLTGERGGTESYMQRSEEAARQSLQNLEESAERFYDFEHRAGIKEVVDSPTPANIARFIAEEGPSQIPYMIAAGISYPLIVSVVGNMVAEDRARNNLNVGLPTDTEMGIGALTAGATGLIERYSLSKLLRSGKAPMTQGFLSYAGKEIPKAIGREAGTEFIQEGIEALGGSIGTEKGVDAQDVFEQALSGAILGGGMGAGVRSLTVYPEYSQGVYLSSIRELGTVLGSEQEQNWLDEHIYLAQQSALGPRSSEAFEDFLNHVDPDANVLLDAETAGELEGAPVYVLNQLDGTGADVVIPMSTYLRDFVVKNPDWGTFTRQHIKLTEHGKTQSELEGQQESPQVKSLIERAQANEETITEADRIYEQVKGQLVETRRQGAATASQSAELIKAYLVTKRENLKARGIDATMEELFGDIGLTVIGPGQKQEGEFLSESERTEYEQAVAKKLPMDKESRMQRAREMGFDTDIVWYHYTPSENAEDLTGFDSSRRGENTLSNASSPGYAMTSLVGDFFNSGGTDLIESESDGAVIPVYLREQDEYYEVGNLDEFATELEDHAVNEIGLDWEYLQNPDDLYGDYKPVADSYREKLMDQGYSGIVYSDNEYGGKSIVAFSSNEIRSINAAFDPDFKDTPNILAQQDFGDVKITDTELAQTRLDMIEKLRACIAA